MIRGSFWQSLKKIIWVGFRATLKFRSLFGPFARRRRGKASKKKSESVHAAMDFPERGEGRVSSVDKRA